VRLLADECCDPRLVAALRGAGHDVRYVLESDAGASDEHVAALSAEQGRILITEDKDFGELALRHGKPYPGLSCFGLRRKTGVSSRREFWRCSPGRGSD
jgi:predicted nuclease of predicted toxin-antitoxin system